MSSKHRTYHLEPQRSDGAGFYPCLDHQAQRWVVLEVTVFRRGKRNMRSTRRIAIYTEMREANSRLAELTAGTKPRRAPQSGMRFPRSGRPIIARSLSYEQYHGISRTDKEA